MKQTLDADEIEMLQGIFSLDEMVARSHGANGQSLHGWYQWYDIKEHWKYP